MQTTRVQFGVQRKTQAQLNYFQNANGIAFQPILEYRALTVDQIAALNKAYYNDGHLVGFKKLFEAVRTALITRHPPDGLKPGGVLKYYPTRVQVQAWLDTQELVQRYKPIRNQKIHQPIRVKAALDRLQIDILNMSSANAYGGYKYILNAIDIFTKKAWAQLINTPNDGVNKTAPTAIKTRTAFFKILDDIHNEYGVYPKRFQTDGGPEFLGVFKKAFTQGQGPGEDYWMTSSTPTHIHTRIKTNFSIAYRATSQSIVERFNRTLRSMIAKHIRFRRVAGGGVPNWPSMLQKFITNYNSSVHSGLKMSPNDMFKTDPVTLAKVADVKVKQNLKLLERNKNFLILKVGQKVRLKDYKEAKSELNKDKPKWSNIIFTVDGLKLNRSTNIREYYIHDPRNMRDPRTSLKANIGVGVLMTENKRKRRRFGIYDLLPISEELVTTLQAAQRTNQADPDPVDPETGDIAPPTPDEPEMDPEEGTARQKRAERNRKSLAAVGKWVHVSWAKYANSALRRPWMENMETDKLGAKYSFWGEVKSYNPTTKLHEVEYGDGTSSHNLYHPGKSTNRRGGQYRLASFQMVSQRP